MRARTGAVALCAFAVCVALASGLEMDTGRRAAFMSTTGSFTLSGASNRAGNDESMELKTQLQELGDDDLVDLSAGTPAQVAASQARVDHFLKKAKSAGVHNLGHLKAHGTKPASVTKAPSATKKPATTKPASAAKGIATSTTIAKTMQTWDSHQQNATLSEKEWDTTCYWADTTMRNKKESYDHMANNKNLAQHEALKQAILKHRAELVTATKAGCSRCNCLEYDETKPDSWLCSVSTQNNTQNVCGFALASKAQSFVDAMNAFTAYPKAPPLYFDIWFRKNRIECEKRLNNSSSAIWTWENNNHTIVNTCTRTAFAAWGPTGVTHVSADVMKSTACRSDKCAVRKAITTCKEVTENINRLAPDAGGHQLSYVISRYGDNSDDSHAKVKSGEAVACSSLRQTMVLQKS